MSNPASGRGAGGEDSEENETIDFLHLALSVVYIGGSGWDNANDSAVVVVVVVVVMVVIIMLMVNDCKSELLYSL